MLNHAGALGVLRETALSEPDEMMIDMANRVCWFCKMKSHQTRQDSVHQIRAIRTNPVTRPSYGVCSLYLCDECRSPSIGVAIRPADLTMSVADRWMDGQTELGEPDIKWLPQHGVSHEFPDVPEHIASAASEAFECHSIGAHRATCSLARAVIEATAKEKGITSGQIFQKIEEMEKQGLIRPHIKDAAHEVRHLGNSAAHGDFVTPVDEEEATEVLGLMEEVLNEVFQSPAKIAKRARDRIAKQANGSGTT